MSYRFDREPVIQPEFLKAARKLPPQLRHYQFIGPYCLPPSAQKRRITVAEIKAVVSRFYRVPISEMVSARRGHDVAHPRQVAMYLAKTRTPRSLPHIGRMFGGRDHTTVIHAIRAVEKRRRASPEYDAALRDLEARL